MPQLRPPSELETLVGNEGERLDDLEAAVLTLQGQVTTLASAVTSLGTSITALQTADVTLDGRLDAVEAIVDSSRGESIIATAQSRTNVAYGTLTTPDQVTGLVVTANDVIKVDYRALWKTDVGNGLFCWAAIFVGSNQLKAPVVNTGVFVPRDPQVAHQKLTTSPGYVPLYTNVTGLYSSSGVEFPSGLSTTSNTNSDVTLVTTGLVWPGAPVQIDGLPAGTYTVSVQFKSETNSVTVKDRVLHAWVEAF